jgi:hypothetical protein
MYLLAEVHVLQQGILQVNSMEIKEFQHGRILYQAALIQSYLVL